MNTQDQDEVTVPASVSWKGIAVAAGIIAACALMVSSIHQCGKQRDLESRMKAAESANKDLVGVNAKLLEEVKAMKAESLEPKKETSSVAAPAQGKEFAIQIATYYERKQIALGQKETSAAFEACGKEVALAFCVVKIAGQKLRKGRSPDLVVLARAEDGLTEKQAKDISECFNRELPPPEGQDNDAHPEKLEKFESECQSAG